VRISSRAAGVVDVVGITREATVTQPVEVAALFRIGVGGDRDRGCQPAGKRRGHNRRAGIGEKAWKVGAAAILIAFGKGLYQATGDLVELRLVGDGDFVP